MESCDVLVVGGGPAGSSLAWKLRNSGLDILILDKSTFPRDKVCAGWVTPPVFETLKIDTDEYRQNRALQPITGFLTAMMGGTDATTEYGKIVSYGIRRSEFDHYLLERSGARLMLGEALKSVGRSNGYWVVNESIKTPLVIGAGGHFCPISRFMGPDNGEKYPAVIAQEIEFEMDERQLKECGIKPEMPELYFCDDLRGYGWCFRKGNFLNIGLGREDNTRLPWHVGSFCALLREKKKIPHDTPTAFKGHAYRLYKSASQKLVEDGVMLIGDAAGLAYPQSGEGIRPAIESALMAADVVVAAAGNYKKEQLHLYPELLRKRFGNGNSGDLLHMLPERFKIKIARHLMASKWFSRHIVLDRWFLHSHQGPL